MFGDSNQQHSATALALLSPRQSRRSVADYAAEFHCPAADTAGNEAAQQFYFRAVWKAAPTTLNEFISLSINIDAQLVGRECEHHESWFENSCHHTGVGPSPPPEPMRVDGFLRHLTTAEKQCPHKQDLCLFYLKPLCCHLPCQGTASRKWLLPAVVRGSLRGAEFSPPHFVIGKGSTSHLVPSCPTLGGGAHPHFQAVEPAFV